MKDNNPYNKPRFPKKEVSSFPEIEVSFSKSKDEVWGELSDMLNLEEADVAPNEPIHTSSKVVKMPLLQMAAAAIVTLLISVSTFAYLYTTTEEALIGEHLSALLPDGSVVELNAQSSISYKPYWWRLERTVKFEGEGFFKVMKGESFTVESSRGRTMVLGTSFNIYARNAMYKVTCYTGKVRVVSIENGHSIDIVPNELAEINNDGSIALRQLVKPEENISWLDDMFIFTATPVQLVFEEIERQYATSIHGAEKWTYQYSGNFTRNRPVEEVLSMVCKPLGLKYKATKHGFVVSKIKVGE